MNPCRPDCQCPNCDPEMLAIMGMNSEQYSGWLRLNSAKTRMLASTRRATLRTTAVPQSTTISPPATADYAPPEPYTVGIAALRSADSRDASATPTEAVVYDPSVVPQSWDLAKKRLEAQ